MIRPLLMEQTHLGANSNYDQALSYGLYKSQTPYTASDDQAHTTGILEDVDMCCLLCLCAYVDMCRLLLMWDRVSASRTAVSSQLLLLFNFH